jgi:glycosyltransferase involved in cell wall biosynthesis
MMTRRGHEVILYGGQENEAECSEFVTCHDAVGPDFFVPPWTQEYFQPMNERVVVEMRKRIQPGDLILLSMGVVQLPIQDAFPGNISVEYCVGYGGATAPARVFPSEAWRHVIYGHRAENVMVIRGYCTDAVIPHFLDPDQFPFGKGGDYLLFVGRLGGLKGEEIAVQTSQMTGIPLKIVGPGPATAYGEYLGVVGPKERAELMGGALALMMPSQFPEPFGLVAIEAQMCGTPVLSTDWGAATETVQQDVSGYRCSTMGDFVAAALQCPTLNRTKIRKRALSLYSTDAVAPQYERFFERLKTIYPTHFPEG